MPGEHDVDKARRINILPTNAAGVVELNSNFTTIITPVNPETAGEDCTPAECGSVAAVAENFKPALSFEVTSLSNLGAEEAEETKDSVTMRYGEEPAQIMSDFSAENITVKARNDDGERVLLNQQLAFHALEELQKNLQDQKFAQLVDNNRETVIQMLEQEIVRLTGLLEESHVDALST